MSEIVPAILEKDFREIKNKLSILRGRTRVVQLDICDGVFVPSQTWPFTSGGIEDADFQKILNEEEGMPYWQDFDFELDLMVSDVVENFDLYAKLGAKRVVLHLSAQKDVAKFINFLEGLDMYIRDNIEIGLAFRPSDDMEVVKKLSHKVDFLQCMGSDRIGIQGELLHDEALERIKTLKKELPGIVISLDIGINLENVKEVIASGVDRLSIGSGIWKHQNPLRALEIFQSLV